MTNRPPLQIEGLVQRFSEVKKGSFPFCKQGSAFLQTRRRKKSGRKRSICCFAKWRKTIPVVKERVNSDADDGDTSAEKEANPVAADADDGRMGCADAALHLPAGATVARAAGASFRVSPLALLLI